MIKLRERGGRDSNRKLRERERAIEKERLVIGGSWATRSVKRRQASWGAISRCVWGWGGGSMACLFFKLTFFLLFLSLSSSVCEFGNHLKVKQKHKWFFGSNDLFYGQSLRFSIKLYFTCAPKHATGCKIFFGNHLHPKQTQPLSRLSKSGSYVGSLKVSGKVDRRIRLWIVRSYIFSNLKQKTH